MATPQDSPYLYNEPFAPNKKPQEDPVEIKLVEGQFPQDIVGTYYRNGPNPVYEPPGLYHWFDGDGCIHAVRLANGVATYVARQVETHKLKTEKSAGKSLYGGFRSKPKLQNFLDYYFKGLPLFPDVSNTDLIAHNSKLYSVCAPLGQVYEVDPLTLQTVSTQNFNGQLKNLVAAHSKLDPHTNEIVFYGFDASPLSFGKPKIYHNVVSRDGLLVKSTALKIERPKNMHDFAITQNHTVFFDQPLEITLKGLEFKPTVPSRMGILPRHGNSKDVRWIEMPADYIIHTGNAFEKDSDHIVIYACDVEGLNDPSRDEKYLKFGSYYTRWTLDIRNLKLVEKTRLMAEAVEFPSINESFLTRENQYSYCARFDENSKFYEFDALVKYDHKTNQKLVYEFGGERRGNEFCFAPRKESQKEDDGYLVGYVLDKAKHKSEFLVIQAHDMRLAARFEIPTRVPSGFHGLWRQH